MTLLPRAHRLDAKILTHSLTYIPKVDWTKEKPTAEAVERGVVYQTLACHNDPRPRMPGHENVAPFVCPHCAQKITPEFKAQEKAELAAMSDADRKQRLRDHRNSHAGAELHQEVVLFMDHRWRASSNLHRCVQRSTEPAGAVRLLRRSCCAAAAAPLLLRRCCCAAAVDAVRVRTTASST